jgi:CubicO group peptidase (beta-lactamase class C family)
MYLTDKIDELFAAWDKPNSPGCALAVIKDGEIIYKRCYGMADLERNVPLNPASVFDIGSTGKQFTAMVIAILAKQGTLSLDNSIQKYIPEMPIYEQPVTIRHLIHHTSGIHDYLVLMYLSGMRSENFYYEDELLDLICRQKKLNFKPGDEFEYSNSGYFLLGVIAKRATGKSLPQLIKENILEPLGMQATNFNDDPKRIVKNRAIGYSYNDGDGFYTEMSFNGGYGDGALLSTVEDLFLWDQNFYNNKLGGGGNELIQEVLMQGVLNSGEKLDYAFGLGISDYKGLRKIDHSGEWAGYTAELIRFSDQKFSVICLANLNSIDPGQLAQQVADLYLVDQFTEQEQFPSQKVTEFIELPTHQIDNIVGLYYNQKYGSILKLSTNEGKLAGEVFDLSFQLGAVSSTQFKAIETPFDIQMNFEEQHPESTSTINIKKALSNEPWLYQKIPMIPIDPSQFVDYLGDYLSDELNTLYKVLLDGEQLCLKRGYSPTEALQPITRDLFIVGDMHFQFERNEQDRVYAFRLRVDQIKDIRFIK